MDSRWAFLQISALTNFMQSQNLGIGMLPILGFGIGENSRDPGIAVTYGYWGHCNVIRYRTIYCHHMLCYFFSNK